MITSAVQAEELPDSGLVRLRIDREGAEVRLNGEGIVVDSYGDSLHRAAWFMLRLPTGIHHLQMGGEGLESQVEVAHVLRNEVLSLDINLGDLESGTTLQGSALPELSAIEIHSDPERGRISLGGVELGIETPAVFHLQMGDHEIAVLNEGYESLSDTISLARHGKRTAQFLLREEEPAPWSEIELGLEYQSETPPLHEEDAEMIRKKYTSLAESFAIVPLSQGILARILMGGDFKRESELLITSGAILTVGSYYIGKVLSSSRREKIIAHNVIIETDNYLVKENNAMVARLVHEKNMEMIAEWKARNSRRGRVEVSDR